MQLVILMVAAGADRNSDNVAMSHEENRNMRISWGNF
jgi:hypothetical protein